MFLKTSQVRVHWTRLSNDGMFLMFLKLLLVSPREEVQGVCTRITKCMGVFECGGQQTTLRHSPGLFQF